MIDDKLLRAKIISAGFNNATLAKEIGVNPCTLSNLLTKKTNPSYHLIKSLVETLKISSDEFPAIFMPDMDTYFW
ncbi:helix-turn-helix domain-containing protein [Aerococcaceae bacterium WGS1372]